MIFRWLRRSLIFGFLGRFSLRLYRRRSLENLLGLVPAVKEILFICWFSVAMTVVGVVSPNRRKFRRFAVATQDSPTAGYNGMLVDQCNSENDWRQSRQFA